MQCSDVLAFLKECKDGQVTKMTKLPGELTYRDLQVG